MSVTKMVKRSTAGLRETLFDALDDLNAGKRAPQDVVAVCRVAGAIIDSVSVEIEFHKHVTARKGDAVKSTVLQLASV